MPAAIELRCDHVMPTMKTLVHLQGCACDHLAMPPRSRHRRKQEPMPFGAQVITGCLAVGLVVFFAAPMIQTTLTGSTAMADQIRANEEQQRMVEQSRHFRNCNEARSAGVAPIYRGSPGYRSELDGDSDGIACEPYYGN